MKQFTALEIVEFDTRDAGTITAASMQDAVEFLIDQLVESGDIVPTEDGYICDHNPTNGRIWVDDELIYQVVPKSG